MNPLTQVKNTQKITAREAAAGISEQGSWHERYKDSAYIYIGGLPFDLTEGDLLAVFAQYGEIVDVNLVRDKGTGKSKGFAFVAYENQKSTILAVDNLNGARVIGRTIRVDHVVNYKKKKEEDEEEEQRKREERGVCYAFQRGECNRGAGCKFSHDEQRNANTGWGKKEDGPTLGKKEGGNRRKDDGPPPPPPWRREKKNDDPPPSRPGVQVFDRANKDSTTERDTRGSEGGFKRRMEVDGGRVGRDVRPRDENNSGRGRDARGSDAKDMYSRDGKDGGVSSRGERAGGRGFRDEQDEPRERDGSSRADRGGRRDDRDGGRSGRGGRDGTEGGRGSRDARDYGGTGHRGERDDGGRVYRDELNADGHKGGRSSDGYSRR
ncbi:hypothetical protein Mapa_006879 [Marchantia paleacea]|nr:hypothetical protein Mapa_006879 [Marchantia paleacea]